MRNYILTTLLLTTTVITSFSQRPDFSKMPSDATLKAVIVDTDTKDPIQYASLALYNLKDSSVATGAIANEDGIILLKDLSYGPYYVEVNFIGYEKKRINRVMISPRNKDLDLGIIEIGQSAIKLDEAEVVAERKHIEYRIDRKVINVTKDLVGASGTAVDILENTPSIETDIDGNVSLRGSSSFQVLIDGRPSVLDGNDILQQIPATSIEQIEIITNPSAKYDPDGVAGIINIVMKKQKISGLSGIINAKAGSFGTYSTDVLLSYKFNKVNVFAGFETGVREHPGSLYMNRANYLEDTTYLIVDSDRSRNRSGYKAKAGIEYDITKKDFVSLNGEYGDKGSSDGSDSKYHQFDLPLTLDDYYIINNDNTRDNEYYSVNLLYLHKFDGMKHQITFSSFYSNNIGDDIKTLNNYITDPLWEIDYNTIEQQKTTETEDENKFKFKVDYTKSFKEKAKLEAGLQARFDMESETYLLENFDKTNDIWVENTSITNSTDFKRNIYSAYTTYSSAIVGFEYMLGLRSEYTDRSFASNILNSDYPPIQRLDFFPTIHFSRKLPANQQLLASYSRRIDRPRSHYLDPFPNYSDPNNVRMGNPNIEPEYINSFELSYQKRIKSTFLSLETYYRETKNKINRISYLDTSNVMFHTFANLESDYSIGVELMANADIFKWWNISLSGNLYNYHIDGEIIETDVNQSINTWSTRFNTTFKLKTDTRIQLNGYYSAPSITAQGDRDDFFFVSAAVKQELLKNKLSVSFQVRDIFKTMNHAFTSYGPNFYNEFEFTRRSPSYSITLSYNFNNYKQRRQRMDNNMEFEDSGDMI